MSRDIKFRAWYKDKMYNYLELVSDNGSWFVSQLCEDDGNSFVPISSNVELMQFTGLLDKNGKEIYEGDIFRVEEENNNNLCDQCDGVGWYEGGEALQTQCEHCNGSGGFVGDHVYYLVIVWVKEWAMFATLVVDNEYFEYTNNGIEALDEPMFWTYTLEDTDSGKFFLCGDIYRNPELLLK